MVSVLGFRDPRTCGGELTYMGTFAIELIPAAWLQKATAQFSNQRLGKEGLGFRL